MRLLDYNAVIVNSSAGKDSQTALRFVVNLAGAQGFDRRNIVVSHQDLGDMEWPGTKELARKQAFCYGIRFEVTKYRNKHGEERSLLEYVESRGKWPDNKNRYCTSDFKRGPGSRVVTKIARELRNAGISHPRLLVVFGLRAGESNARAKKPVLQESKLSRQSYSVFEWLPIHDWTEDEVWADIKNSGVPYHGAYDKGMPRLSCTFCIFASRSALLIAGRERPALLSKYVEVEAGINHTFRKNQSLSEIQDTLRKEG